MQPKQQKESPQLDMFRKSLENMLSHQHGLYRLAGLIDVFELEFGKLHSEEGRPGISLRPMVGLTYLGHAFGISAEEGETQTSSAL